MTIGVTSILADSHKLLTSMCAVYLIHNLYAVLFDYCLYKSEYDIIFMFFIMMRT